MEQTFWLIFATILLHSSEDISPPYSRSIALLECEPMRRDVALLWSYANVLTRKRYDVLVGRFGSIDEAPMHFDMELLRGIGCREDAAMAVINRIDSFDPDAYEEELRRRSLTLVTWDDAAYPSALREIADPPVFLYYKGSLDILKQPCIACVGTRSMSAYGKRVVSHFVPSFVRAGLTTVSGLA